MQPTLAAGQGVPQVRERAVWQWLAKALAADDCPIFVIGFFGCLFLTNPLLSTCVRSVIFQCIF